MDGKSFAAIRAEKSDNCMDWTPEDCIRELLRMMESGETSWDRILIMGVRETEDGKWEVERWRAKMPRAEEAYLLLIQQAAVVE